MLRLLPLDLHVLSTPPAFNLSQDQTLHLKLLNFQLKRVNSNPLLDFLVTRSMTPKCMTRVPTQITCRIFKQHPGRWDTGDSLAPLGASGGRKYSDLLPSVNPQKRFIFLAEIACFCALRSLREGAQYSGQRGAVNGYVAAPENRLPGSVRPGWGAVKSRYAKRPSFAREIHQGCPKSRKFKE